jgi:hypothetical protein
MHMPSQVLRFIFNLQEKKLGKTHICSQLLLLLPINQKVCLFTHITSYILEQPNVVSNAANESILAPLSKQTESSHSPSETGRLTLMAWLGYFFQSWLAQILLLITAPTQTLLNHIYIYTSWQKQKQYQAQFYSQQTHIHNLFTFYT